MLTQIMGNTTDSNIVQIYAGTAGQDEEYRTFDEEFKAVMKYT